MSSFQSIRESGAGFEAMSAHRPQPSGSIRNARSFRIGWRRRAAVQSAALAVTSAADSDGNRSAAAPFRRIIDDAYRAVISSGHETTQIFRIII
jgi:hypothetical protein